MKNNKEENKRLIITEIGNFNSEELFENHPEIKEMVEDSKVFKRDLQLFSVTMWFRCPRCGGENIAPDTKFCPDCGIKINK